jgi:hypothetical protein
MPDDPKPSAESELRAAKPIHCVSSDGTVRVLRRTGRPKKIEHRPTVDQNDYAERVAEIAERFIADDELVRASAVRHDRDDPAVVDEALRQLAKEQSCLHFDRIQAMNAGRALDQTSSRRVEALSKMAGLVLLRARACPEELDVRSARFQAAVEDFVACVRAAADETLAAETADRFVATYLERLSGWEGRVGD